MNADAPGTLAGADQFESGEEFEVFSAEAAFLLGPGDDLRNNFV